MKRFFTFLILLFLSTSAFAQSDWNLVWKMDTMPFSGWENDTTKKVSEMAIVKAGFDTDQDGWGEFLCAWTDMDSNYTLMYEATGDDTYELVWYWQHPGSGNSFANTFAGIAVGDIDNNGKVDILCSLPSVVNGDSPSRLWVFEWSGVVGENKYGRYTDDGMMPTNEWNYNVPDGIDFRPYSQTIEDIDKDGVNELITGVRQGDRGREVVVSSVVGQLSGFGSFNVEFNFAQNFGGSNYCTTTGDLDGDGNTEIYMFIWNMFTMRIFECMGDQQYETVFEVDELYGDENIDYGGLDGLRVADVNGDGVNEMYMAGTEPQNQIFIVTGISDISQMTSDDIQELLTIPATGNTSIEDGVGKFRSMYMADPDKDGNLSMMIAGERNGQIYDVEYKGEGDPADSASWDVNVIFDIWELSGFGPDDNPTLSPRMFYGHPADDMDNDGRDEYLFVNYSTDHSVWDGDAYVWILEIGEATNIKDADNLPNSIVLKQNYPNPFNPATNIEFSLNEMSNVRLVVYDVLGRELETLVKSSLPAGVHSYEFNAANYSTGIYYYSLFVGNGSSDLLQTKKMMLLK
jgi:hypothetical protein